MKPKILSLAGALLAATSSSAWAHPGHEHPVTPPEHPMHWFIEPEHVAGWIGIACVVVVFLKARQLWLRNEAKKSPARDQHPH